MAHSANRDRLHKTLVLMVLVGLALRMALVVWLHYYDFGGGDMGRFAPKHSNFAFGYETGAIAYSLATGHGFSSPFGGSTGPTAWVAPLYPALCALVFKILGCFTLAAGFVILLINSLLSALTCIPIYRIGEMTVGRKVGYWSGWVWAAGVMFMRWPTTWVWDMAASALLVSILLLLSLQLGEEGTLKRWSVFGLTWGIAALTNPALLAFLPAAGLYPVLKLRRCHRSWFQHAALSAVLFAAVISPWLIRNRITLGTWVFIRGNAGFEFSIGNYHGSNGMGWFGKHPTQNKWEYADYNRMGEIAYVAEHKQRAIEFVRQQPGEFAALCATRVEAFWMGTQLNYVPQNHEPWRTWFYWPLSTLMFAGLIAAVARREKGAWLYFGLMLLYPITYYLIFAQPRYRHAIEPEMLLLSTYSVYTALEYLAKRFPSQTAPRVELQPALIDGD